MISYEEYKKIVIERSFSQSLKIQYNLILIYVDSPLSFLSSTTDYFMIKDFCAENPQFDLTETLRITLPGLAWIEQYRQFEANYYGHELEYVSLPNAPYMN